MQIPESYIVDLFCGIGGLSHGLKMEGLNIVAGIDFDESCRFAFEKNNKAPFHHMDLLLTHSREIEELYPKDSLKVLVGCAPCQSFSSYSHRYKDSDKWKMLYSFGRFIKEIKPEIISMENVSQLKSYRKGKVFKDFVAVLEEEGYYVSYEVVNAADYGVPQNRNRLILLASKLGEINLIEKTHSGEKHVTVRDAIGHLPPIKDGETFHSDPLHKARKLSPINKQRIQATPIGGGWKDWDESLMLECHKKPSGKTYSSVYGRMRWDQPSPTITTQCTGLGNGRFGHPEQNRAISVREAALLQSFPKKFKFYDDKNEYSTASIQRHIGNAVPVLLGVAIGKSIKNHIHGIYKKS